MKPEITNWAEFKRSPAMPTTEGLWRRSGNTLEIFAEQASDENFRVQEFLLEQNLDLAPEKLGPKATVTRNETQWEIDCKVRVPKFQNFRQKLWLMLTWQRLYHIETQRIYVTYVYGVMPLPDLNPRFLSRRVHVLIPIRDRYREEG